MTPFTSLSVFSFSPTWHENAWGTMAGGRVCRDTLNISEGERHTYQDLSSEPSRSGAFHFDTARLGASASNPK